MNRGIWGLLLGGAFVLLGVSAPQAAMLPQLAAETANVERVQYREPPRVCWIDRYGSRVCGRPWQRDQEMSRRRWRSDGGYRERAPQRVCWLNRRGERVCGLR
jgi:hypothetical protein